MAQIDIRETATGDGRGYGKSLLCLATGYGLRTTSNYVVER